MFPVGDMVVFMLVTPAQMAKAEKYSDSSGISLKMLMDNAGRALSDAIGAKYENGSVLFLCGNGNNGGDGFVAARILHKARFDVCVALLCGKPKTDLAKDSFALMEESGVKVIEDLQAIQQCAENASIIVECVFGTGFRGKLDERLSRIFSFGKTAFRISADIPAGVNGFTGSASDGTFKADLTLAFGSEKVGHAMYPAKDFCGSIAVADIGIPVEAYQDFDENFLKIQRDYAKLILPKRKSDAHKGDFGTLLCVCSNENMPGAIGMCINAALRSGAGLVRGACPKSVVNSIFPAIFEATWLPLEADINGFSKACNAEKILQDAKKCSAVVIGCGLGVTDETRELVKELINNLNCPIILDADGINCIADSIDILLGKDNIVLTPHLGEAARILKCTVQEIMCDKISAAKSIAQTGCTVVLKGAATIVAKGGKFAINTTGNPGMSRGGSGDVLAGVIGALAAQRLPVFEAAALGVFVHGAAGDIAAKRFSQQACLPRDFIDCLSEAFADIENN